MFNCKFVRNIAYYTSDGGRWLRERNADAWDGGQLLWTYCGHKDDFPEFEFDYNTVYAPPGVDLKVELTLLPEPRQLLTWDQWRQTGKDEHSVFADPLFVDPANHDYRLKPDSPALKLGFKPIPLDKIGPYEDKLRELAYHRGAGRRGLGRFHHRALSRCLIRATPASEFTARSNCFAARSQPVTLACFAGATMPRRLALP